MGISRVHVSTFIGGKKKKEVFLIFLVSCISVPLSRYQFDIYLSVKFSAHPTLLKWMG